MKPPDFEYVRATSVPAAVAALSAAGGEAKVLAGGQSLVPLLNFRLALPAVLVDVNPIPELNRLEATGGVLRIGATTRARTLELDPLVRDAVPILAAASRWIGHVQIRNRGTVGGSIAHADPAAELPAVCVLLDADLIAVGPGGERSIPAADFFAGFLTTALAEDELLTEIRIPLRIGQRWGFREFAPRRGDFALAGAAVALAGDGAPVDRARVVVFGTADRPVRCSRAEDALDGRQLDEATILEAAALAADEATVDDPRPDADYRRTLTRTMVRRALEDAIGEAGRDARLEVA